MTYVTHVLEMLESSRNVSRLEDSKRNLLERGLPGQVLTGPTPWGWFFVFGIRNLDNEVWARS